MSVKSYIILAKSVFSKQPLSKICIVVSLLPSHCLFATGIIIECMSKGLFSIKRGGFVISPARNRLRIECVCVPRTLLACSQMVYPKPVSYLPRVPISPRLIGCPEAFHYEKEMAAFNYAQLTWGGGEGRGG
jgi:hypothetical protein